MFYVPLLANLSEFTFGKSKIIVVTNNDSKSMRESPFSQSGGSSTEVFAVPETPAVPPKDAKARVRFAVEEGEAPGDRPLDPEVLMALSLCLLCRNIQHLS